MRERGPLANLLEIEQPIINDIFILKPTFFLRLSFTTGGRTWGFGCILQIKREEKSRIQGLYHLKFLITFGCTVYRARFLIMHSYVDCGVLAGYIRYRTENSENKPRGVYFSKPLFEGLIFRGAYIRLGLYLEGNLRLQIDWAPALRT